jgi:hypothetical protein
MASSALRSGESAPPPLAESGRKGLIIEMVGPTDLTGKDAQNCVSAAQYSDVVGVVQGQV